MGRLGSVALLLMLGLPLVGQAAEYVRIGKYATVRDSQQMRERLEREGFPVVERLVPVSAERTAILVLVGPFDGGHKAREQLNRLNEMGWKGVLQHFDSITPPLRPAKEHPPEPVAPESRVELERPPELGADGATQMAKITAPDSVAPLPGTVLPDDEGEGSSVFPKQRRLRLSGYATLDGRYFREEALYPEQSDTTSSIVLQPELYMAWRGGDSTLTFSPFVRAGDVDDERNHADVRELIWSNNLGDWDLRLGVGRVFWGVTESQHLVDVINQLDMVEDLDGESKLGQPMVNLSHSSPWGTLELYALPGFRERTFAGLEGRLRGPLLVDTDQTVYESPDKDRHLDWAVRWSHYIGDVDIGLSHFSGTARAPRLELGFNGQGQPVLVPHYDLLQQTGLSLQALAGAWTWKLEAVSAAQRQERHLAVTAGFEYTHVGLLGSQMDLGMLAEYLYDERGVTAPTPFANDLMVGLRWVFNDIQSSEILVGMIRDLDGSANSVNIEASRRLGQNWKVSLEYRGNNAVEATDRLYPIRMDDYLQLELFRYF